MSVMTFFETENDLKRENTYKESIEKKINLELVKLPRSYSVDFAAVDSKKVVRYYIEIKTRKKNSREYTKLIVSSKKIKNMKVLSNVGRIPSFVFFCFPREIKYIRVDNKHFEEKIFTDPRKRDETDTEPCVSFAVKDLKLL